MPQPALEIIGAPQGPDALPFEVIQKTSWTSAVARLALLAPALMMVLLPAAVLVAGPSSTATQVAAHPSDAIIAAAGGVLLVVLFGFPLRRVVGSFGVRRTVKLEATEVTVEEANPFRRQSWTAPLADYEGVAHVVRTSLSGVRHELVLVHPDRRRQVLVHAADRLSEADVTRIASLLRLPMVPAERVLWPRRAPAASRRVHVQAPVEGSLLPVAGLAQAA